jgi:hypothetical protein
MLINVFFRRQLSHATLAVLLLAGFVGVSRLDAQATGSISGTVTDTSGAAIAEAAMQVRNLGTGIAACV